MSNVFIRRVLTLATCTVAALASAGCLNMERSILVNRDLTGRAALKMAIDFDALVPLVIKMQHQAEGKTDPPTEAEIAAAKAQMASMAALMPSTGPFDAKKIAAGLPEGMTVVDSTQKIEGNKLVINLVIGFQDVMKVPLIAMPSIDAAPAGVDTAMKLFQDIEIKDEGGTILIASKAPVAGDPTTSFQPPISSADLMSTLASTTGMKPEDLTPLVNEMMRGLKFATRIESPLTVVDTNATTREGTSLTWSVNFDGGLEKMLAADPKSTLVSVRFKK